MQVRSLSIHVPHLHLQTPEKSINMRDVNSLSLCSCFGVVLNNRKSNRSKHKSEGFASCRIAILFINLNHAKNLPEKVHYNHSGLKKKFTTNEVTPVIVNSGYSEPIFTVPWEFTITGIDCTCTIKNPFQLQSQMKM